jgi:YjjG family noncanonical pyrimidine nucleotidase
MFSKYDWLLFDLDNTLLDFSITSKLAFNELMTHFEIEEAEKAYAVYAPINAKHWSFFEKQRINADAVRYGRFKEFLSAISSNIPHDDMAHRYLDLLVKHSHWVAGAENLIKNLSKTHQLGIITNGLKDAQHARLEKHDMKQYFKHVFISEEMGVSKPHAAFFEQVHETIKLPLKEKVLVIGDNPKSDIKGGKNFNYHTCWYNYKKDKKQSVKAHFKVNSWLDQ